MSTSSNMILGVDGGGTKTIAWLAENCDTKSEARPYPSTQVLGIGQAGPGNVRSAGFECATTNIFLAIANAFERAGLSVEPASSACLCLAGAGREDEQQKLYRWAESKRIAQTISIVDDAQALLAVTCQQVQVAMPESQPSQELPWDPWLPSGIALIAGTGSLASGRNRGHTARSGGWGYLIDDGGSGYWLGARALRAACHAHDGSGPATTLLSSICAQWSMSRFTDIISRVYESSAPRAELAALAPLVFAESTHDAVAVDIVNAGVRELASNVAAVASQLQFSNHSFLLAGGGALFTHQRPYFTSVIERLSTMSLAPRSAHIVDNPVAGALAIAERMYLGLCQKSKRG